MKSLGATTASKLNFCCIVYDVLVEVKDVFLLCCPLVLSLLKLREIGVFWTKKNPVQIGEIP